MPYKNLDFVLQMNIRQSEIRVLVHTGTSTVNQ
jgi:hypothetical protein